VAYHLSVVIDDELRTRLERRARRASTERPFGRQNLSATVRDILRASVGLSGGTADGEGEDDDREWRAARAAGG
jgi:hypothetical protein